MPPVYVTGLDRDENWLNPARRCCHIVIPRRSIVGQNEVTQIGQQFHDMRVVRMSK